MRKELDCGRNFIISRQITGRIKFGTQLATVLGTMLMSFPVKPGMTTTGSDSQGDATMKWTKPAYQDKRFGFELTMYILNR